jgi:ketosteroid isomerase-like protein
MREEEDVVRQFLEAVNAHDLTALSSLMSDDHTFIDSLGQSVSGRPAVLAAWPQYFALFPDYAISVTDLLSSGPTVAVFGFASGTLGDAKSASSPTWRIPAAWRATVRGRRVTRWQVYADNKPVYELLNDPTTPT